MTIVLALMTLAQPYLTGRVIDELRFGTNASIKYVVFLAAVIFILDFLSTIFSNLGGYIGDQMSVRLTQFLSQRYFEHILSLPQQFFDTELTGKLINRLKSFNISDFKLYADDE
jgi:ATP-binding cassette subfamily B protein